MQNVNLSRDEHFNETWAIREVYQTIAPGPEEINFLLSHTVNSEEELYVKGNTAVWSRGSSNPINEKTSSEISYTSESPIQFAFFCTNNFLDADYKIENKPTKRSKSSHQGIGIIDTNSLKVYATNGENLMAAIESPISKIWITKYCILIEKDASTAVVDGHSVAMPRMFSLTHPLDDMYPVLLKSSPVITYLTENDFKVSYSYFSYNKCFMTFFSQIIFSSEDSDIILMFDSRNGKHLVCKLRKATDEETSTVSNLYDTSTMGMNTVSSIGGLSNIQNSLRMSNIARQNVSARHTSSQRFSGHLNLSGPQRASSPSYKSNLASLVDSVRRNSISLVARKIGECEPSKPLVPDLILEQVWTENNGTWNEYHEMANSGFMHRDFIGQRYLCFLLVKSYKLNLLSIERFTSLNTPIFGSMASISARDAIALPRMNMIAALLPCGTLMLYSGPQPVGKVHVGILTNITVPTTFNTPGFPKRSSLLPSAIPSSGDMKFDDEIHMLSPVQPLHSNNQLRFNCTTLRDPAGNRVTLAFSNGKMYRFGFPAMCENSIVRKMIIALRHVMPKESLKLMIRWYGIRNSPGTKDLSLRKEWEMFKSLLMEMMGRPHEVSNCSTSNTTIGAKKRRKSENGTNLDWEYLLQAESFINRDVDEEDQEMIQNYHADAVMFSNIPAILYTMHLLYEDLKLETSMGTELKCLSEFLYQLAIDFELERFRLHYILDNSQLVYIKTRMTVAAVDAEKLNGKELIKNPVNIFQEISALTDNQQPLRKYPFIPNVNRLSKDVYEILSIIFEKMKNPSEAIEMMHIGPDQKKIVEIPRKQNFSASVQKLVTDALISKDITRIQLERLPIAINYIISQTLEMARLNPPIGCSAAAYKLLLRPELYAHAAFIRNKKSSHLSRRQLETSLTPRIQTQPDVIAKSEKALVEDNGMEHIDTKLLRLRFPDDLRINDVKKFLNSSKPVTIDIVQSPNVSDHEFIEEQEKQLFALCTRTMALPIGRGMFTYRTYYPVLTEILPIPKLCLTGKETGRGATIELQQIEVPANMSLWPQFHNGVAAGLRIATDPADIDPAYIMYNKPKDGAEMPCSYAGFLMALGLTSSLKALSDTYLYDYLIRSEELLSVGLLLGMAASHRGTMDTKITRMLSIHVEALLPPTAIELDVSHNVQVASLLGIGMLYQKSCKRHIAEALLQEINRPPGPEMENYVERESYALAAGLALGMVTLESGNKDVGLDDLNLPDTLHYYMIGGTKRLLNGAQKEKYKLPSFQIREGDQINIDVTAPGSTLALGLMFFRSGNQAVADWMKPPETMYLLDFVRPDLLLLRVLARGLIMWDSVEATTEWINSQMSKTLSKIIKQKPDPENDPLDMDHEAICQAYCNIVAGAALVIGLRFAGTEDRVAFKTLKKIITFFLSANGQYIGEYAGKVTVESCIILVLISLSLVFAGTGDLEILRMIRMTRARIGPQNSQVTYGSHMAIHMALGFLFLGAGRYTISRSPEAIASLICALFPKFPTHSNDNRYHLQAFRHLYVLAVEPRLFLPRDIDSGKLVVCKLSYVQLDRKLFITVAPCMLPELDTLKAVHVDDPNYWPITFEKGRNWDQLINLLNANGCIDIVQRAGCLSQLDDPNRLKSMLAQTLTTDKYSCWKVEPSSLLSFSNDRLMVNLTKIMLMVPKFHLVDNLSNESSRSDELREMILLQTYDCLTRDKIHALGIYMAIDNVSINLI